jgi:hypothetical protein
LSANLAAALTRPLLQRSGSGSAWQWGLNARQPASQQQQQQPAPQPGDVSPTQQAADTAAGCRYGGISSGSSEQQYQPPVAALFFDVDPPAAPVALADGSVASTEEAAPSAVSVSSGWTSDPCLHHMHYVPSISESVVDGSTCSGSGSGPITRCPELR